MNLHFLKAFFLMVAVVVAASSCTTSLSGKFSRLPKNLPNNIVAAKTPLQSDFPDSDGVVLYSNSTTDIAIDPSYGLVTNVTHHSLVKVFNNKEDYSKVRIILDDNEILNSIAARTILPDGSMHDINFRDVYQSGFEESNQDFKSKGNMIFFNFPMIQKNAILEFRYKKTAIGPNLNSIWPFVDSIPVLESTYRISYPKFLTDNKEISWSWRYKVYNFKDFPQPSIIEEPGERGSRLYIFKLSNLPAYKKEPINNQVFNSLPHVKFNLSKLTSWDEFGASYYKDIFSSQLQITEKVREVARKIAKNGATEKEKIDAVRMFVASLYYNADHLRFGYGFKPNLPEVILDRGYGDCKDKTILAMALLKSLNIDSYPMIVGSSSDIPVDPDFPINTFNHMILKVVASDNSVYYIDGTVNYAPLNSVISSYAGTYGLLVNPNGKSWIELLPPLDATKNKTTMKGKVNIEKDGSAKIDISIAYSGETAIIARNFFASSNNEGKEQWYKGELDPLFFDLVLEKAEFSPVEKVDSDFLISYSFRVPSIFTTAASFKRLDSMIFYDNSDSNLRLLYNKKRNSPIRFSYAYVEERNLEINFPNNFILTDATAPYVIGMKDNSLTVTTNVEKTENSLKIRETVTRAKIEYGKESYDEIRQLLKSLQNKRSARIFFSVNQS